MPNPYEELMNQKKNPFEVNMNSNNTWSGQANKNQQYYDAIKKKLPSGDPKLPTISDNLMEQGPSIQNAKMPKVSPVQVPQGDAQSGIAQVPMTPKDPGLLEDSKRPVQAPQGDAQSGIAQIPMTPKDPGLNRQSFIPVQQVPPAGDSMIKQQPEIVTPAEPAEQKAPSQIKDPTAPKELPKDRNKMFPDYYATSQDEAQEDRDLVAEENKIKDHMVLDDTKSFINSNSQSQLDSLSGLDRLGLEARRRKLTQEGQFTAAGNVSKYIKLKKKYARLAKLKGPEAANERIWKDYSYHVATDGKYKHPESFTANDARQMNAGDLAQYRIATEDYQQKITNEIDQQISALQPNAGSPEVKKQIQNLEKRKAKLINESTSALDKTLKDFSRNRNILSPGKYRRMMKKTNRIKDFKSKYGTIPGEFWNVDKAQSFNPEEFNSAMMDGTDQDRRELIHKFRSWSKLGLMDQLSKPQEDMLNQWTMKVGNTREILPEMMTLKDWKSLTPNQKIIYYKKARHLKKDLDLSAKLDSWVQQNKLDAKDYHGITQAVTNLDLLDQGQQYVKDDYGLTKGFLSRQQAASSGSAGGFMTKSLFGDQAFGGFGKNINLASLMIMFLMYKMLSR